MADAIDQQNTDSGSQDSQDGSRTNENNHSPQNALVASNPNCVAAETSQSNSQNNNQKSLFDKITKIIEIVVGAFVGGALITVSYWQYSVYTQQAAIMEADHRPRVSINIGVGSLIWAPDGVHVAHSYILRNSGHSTATDVFVQDAVVPFMGPGKDGNIIVQVKKVLDLVKGNPHLGFPLFPEDKGVVSSGAFLAQEDIEAFKRWITGFGTPKAPAPSPDAIPIVIVYAVDYGDDAGGPHHQTFCWVNIGRPNPDNPNGFLAPLINTPIPAGQVKVVFGGMDCGAN